MTNAAGEPNRKKIKRRAVPTVIIDGVDPRLAGIYAARRIRSASELDYSLAGLLPPNELTDIARAVELLAEALAAQARILFVGDFDADGATSCALGVTALRALGAQDVSYLVPNRFEYGYGLTPEIVGVAATRQPDVIVTVDNGIASFDGVLAARELGISVVVTDHHLPGTGLPQADAIVNPNRADDHFPSKALAGVGVVFYVMVALRSRLRELGWFAEQGLPEPNLAELLDLVAVGTVADLVPLDGNNRILVAQGLARINAGNCRAGIRALLEIGGRRIGDIVAADLGFYVAPRLNAAGRLEDMTEGVECLLAHELEQARRLAHRLDALNRQRREIESDMHGQAVAKVDALIGDGALPAGLCLHDESWHQGVIGLIASRVRERFNRPVVIFACGDSGTLKGSARSVEGLHIRDLLDGIATSHPTMLERFGGHAMAAGLSLEERHLEAFRTAFEEAVSRQLGESDFSDVVLTDGPLKEPNLDLEFAELLRLSGPWGQGFPEPLFDDEFEVIQTRLVGESHLKLRLRQPAGGRVVDAIAFRYRERYGEWEPTDRIRVAYRLEVNEFQGVRRAQLVIEHLEAC